MQKNKLLVILGIVVLILSGCDKKDPTEANTKPTPEPEKKPIVEYTFDDNSSKLEGSIINQYDKAGEKVGLWLASEIREKAGYNNSRVLVSSSAPLLMYTYKQPDFSQASKLEMMLCLKKKDASSESLETNVQAIMFFGDNMIEPIIVMGDETILTTENGWQKVTAIIPEEYKNNPKLKKCLSIGGNFPVSFEDKYEILIDEVRVW